MQIGNNRVHDHVHVYDHDDDDGHVDVDLYAKVVDEEGGVGRRT